MQQEVAYALQHVWGFPDQVEEWQVVFGGQQVRGEANELEVGMGLCRKGGRTVLSRSLVARAMAMRWCGKSPVSTAGLAVGCTFGEQGHAPETPQTTLLPG